MPPDPGSIAARVSGETGLAFEGSEGRNGDGHRWMELRPAGHAPAGTFALRTTLAWRRLETEFLPGAFAGDLLETMGAAGPHGRSVFVSVLRECEADGAVIDLTINGGQLRFDAPAVWSSVWSKVALRIVRRQLAVGVEDGVDDQRLVVLWTGRLAAAVLALLPLEEEPGAIGDAADDIIGLPEGAKTRIEVNRYERDRRNRAAALSIHGFGCKACDLNMADRYGDAATGLIEVHHVTPVSVLGEGYVIDPIRDLVPLCPNCHAVTHRRTPPFSVGEVREMMVISPINPSS